MTPVRSAAVVMAAGACLAFTPVGASAPGHETLQQLLTQQLELNARQVDRLRRGEVVVRDVQSPVTRQIGVAGAVRIDAPAARTVDLVRDIERLERGKGFLATRKISEPPTLADFSDFDLPAEDVQALRACRVDDCDVKLGLPMLGELEAVDWSAPDASEVVRRLTRRRSLEYLERYRAGGNAALAVYRDQEHPVAIAREFAEMVEGAAGLTSAFPEVARYLLSYPRHRPWPVEDFYYWSLANFGLKPVYRLNHVVIHPSGDQTGLLYTITTKQLYASHYFHAALEVRALVDDPDRPGRRHYLLVLNLARSDGLTGLFGGIVRRRVRSGARTALQTALANTRTRVETAPQGLPPPR